MQRTGQIVAGMIVNIIITLVISHLATSSLNPVEVYRGDSLLLKLVMGFLNFVLLMSLISVAWIPVVGRQICMAPGCG